MVGEHNARDRRGLPFAAALAALLSQLACAPADGEPAYEIDLDPEEDWTLSPYSGWTRAHHEAVFGRLLLGFVTHLSARGGRTQYAGGESLPASMEGVSRMLPAIGGWLSDPENPAVVEVDGLEIDLVDVSKRALLAATDPDGLDYWYPIEPAWDQKKVEAALVAEFLVHTRDRVWASMSAGERDQIMQWLAPADEDLPGNWGLFLATGNVARRALGYEAPADAIAARIADMEADYGGDGWYFDSNEYRYDYYNAFVIHPGLDFVSTELSDDAFTARSQTRARAYLSHVPYLSSAQGAPVTFGRSLAYRTALSAPVIAAERGDYSPLGSGLSRRLVSGQLRFFMGGRVGSTDAMFDEADVMTRGWRGDDPRVLDSYIRPGSQYFASRVFEALALPREHPFWTDPEQPGPADLGPFVHAIPAPGWVLIGSEDGAHVTLLNGGSNSDRASSSGAYKGLIYSSSFAFDQATDGRFPYDTKVVPAADSSFTSPRSEPGAVEVGPGATYLTYTLSHELLFGVVETRTLAFEHAGNVVRVSCVGEHGSTPLTIYEGGLAVPTTTMSSGDDPVPWARLDSERGSTLLAGVDGFGAVGKQLGFEDRTDLNAIDETTTFPTLVSAPDRRCFVSLLAISTDPTSLDALDLPTTTWEPDVDVVTLAFEDGTLVLVDLSPSPAATTRALGDAQVVGATRFARYRADPMEIELLGADSLSDAQGPIVELEGEQRRLGCRPEGAGLRCHTSAGFTLRTASPVATVEVRAVDGATTDVSTTAITDDGLSMSEHAILGHAEANDLTLVEVHISTM